MAASITPSHNTTPDRTAPDDSRATPPAAVEITDLAFHWPDSRDFRLAVPHFSLPQGETCFLLGPSGSGKSTLLSLLAGLMAPDSGHIRLTGQSLEQASRHARDRFRADHLGLIFQQFNLVPYLSPLANVLLPCQFSRRRRERAGPKPREQALALLSALGLDPARLPRDVRHLSMGQQQRVAAARALIGAPEIVLADEPTSALDQDHRDRFVDLLLGQASAHGASVLFVSHDRSLQQRFTQQQDIRQWRSDLPQESPL
ncbi:MAG: ATP-binding cassette domain-containing protein [Oleiphilaceae bacterium]|nr:ATP-binding cassette domain-containing protein [Oleiphilaceae bacterium]